MRSYGQYCAVAKALDLVGDRWTLLIVREILIQGPCRFTELRLGLPGIASNLLTDRLKQLEQAGLVYRESAPPPVASSLYHLSDRGKALEPVLTALGVWGVELMTEIQPGDVFRSQWFDFVIKNYLTDNDPDAGPIDVDLDATDDPVHLHVDSGKVTLVPGAPERPILRLSGSPPVILGVLTGHVALDAAMDLGLRVTGDVSALRRIQPDRIAQPELRAARR